MRLILLLLALAPQETVRRIPPAGVPLPSGDRTSLEEGLATLGREIDALRAIPAARELLPDVQIYHNAVRVALAYDEFFDAKEIPIARRLLQQGLDRARELRDGKAPWAVATGLVVRGYVSRIDGSVQPYGLVVPPTFQPGAARRHRLDVWFHGRNEKLNEINFIDGRQRTPGEFAPADAIVLHPYGRYCNANKFAGETDTFEALESVRRRYPVDDDRIAVRGFSMGGAAVWHLAAHHAGLWAAAAPGAGFAETPHYLRIAETEEKPPWYEEKLWHLYDSTDYALNLFNCPTVAYSGELDKQKQAADVMAKALLVEGIQLVHVIGPQTEHRYHPESKAEIARRIDAVVARGRDPAPRRVRFVTWTLRYNRMAWVTLEALEKHWERARVDLEIVDAETIRGTTQNVAAIGFSMGPGLCPLDPSRFPKIILDGQEIAALPPLSDRSWSASLIKADGRWASAEPADGGALRKRPGLQGPIDDAFMDAFVFVRPTGRAREDKAGAWAAAEMSRAISEWRRQFRGEARVLDDEAVTDADIASHHLVLWGDPVSNKVLARIADKLPIGWTSEGVRVGEKTYPAATHAPILIHPNPLNPKRYVVLNSGFTFREADLVSNARQTPKLPDWAVVNLEVPPSPRAPGKVVDAGFFDESWKLVQPPK